MRPIFLGAVSLALALLLCPAEVRAKQEDQAPEVSTPVFEFHSSFWVNLHHFLYLQGRIRNSESVTTGTLPAQPGYAAPASTAGMTAEQRKAWNNAVSIYAADWSSRDLESNGDMALINDRLAELEPCADLSGKSAPGCAAGLRPDMTAALDEAAPIYRARWWTEQDHENRAWIVSLAPQVRRMGGSLAQQLAQIYDRGWPKQPIRVDVVWYAGPLGSYATLEPAHVTLGSHDGRNQGTAAFEVLFDEASHTIAGGVREAIAQECRQRAQPIPRDLWKALLYYTADELIRRASAREAGIGLPSASHDTPSANHSGLSEYGWSSYEGILELYWQPYLDSQVDFDTAIARLVSAP